MEEALPLERAVSVSWEWWVRLWSPDSTVPSDRVTFVKENSLLDVPFLILLVSLEEVTPESLSDFSSQPSR